MSNLNFNTSTGVPITLDGESEPSFYLDTTDHSFLEKMKNLMVNAKEFDKKQAKAIKEKNVDISSDEEVVDNVEFLIKFQKENFEFLLKELDDLLGEGVSQKVFKGRNNEGLLSRFLDFIAKTIEHERGLVVSEFTKNREQKRATKKGVI